MTQNDTPQNRTSALGFHALIAAGGSGSRLNADKPKQYLDINGHSILRHTLNIFHQMPECLSIQVIISSDDAESYHDAVNGLDLPEPVAGGKERNISIYNGLKNLSHLDFEDIVLIHDAARPCVNPTDIRKLLSELETHRAVTLATPVTSTLRKGNTQDIALEPVSRENLWEIQTPQAFRYGDILSAHKNADPNKTYTDDSALATDNDIDVKLVEGAKTNIKITTSDDLELAEFLLSKGKNS